MFCCVSVLLFRYCVDVLLFRFVVLSYWCPVVLLRCCFVVFVCCFVVCIVAAMFLLFCLFAELSF